MKFNPHIAKLKSLSRTDHSTAHAVRLLDTAKAVCVPNTAMAVRVPITAEAARLPNLGEKVRFPCITTRLMTHKAGCHESFAPGPSDVPSAMAPSSGTADPPRGLRSQRRPSMSQGVRGMSRNRNTQRGLRSGEAVQRRNRQRVTNTRISRRMSRTWRRDTAPRGCYPSRTSPRSYC